MRSLRLSILIVLLLSMLIVTPALAGSGASDPFKGAWKATDNDGSALTLVISGGGARRHVTLFDRYWDCQSCSPPGYFPSLALGFGEVSGNSLLATLRWHDAPPGVWSDAYPVELNALPDGTLQTGTIIWQRAGR